MGSHKASSFPLSWGEVRDMEAEWAHRHPKADGCSFELKGGSAPDPDAFLFGDVLDMVPTSWLYPT